MQQQSTSAPPSCAAARQLTTFVYMSRVYTVAPALLMHFEPNRTRPDSNRKPNTEPKQSNHLPTYLPTCRIHTKNATDDYNCHVLTLFHCECPYHTSVHTNGLAELNSGGPSVYQCNAMRCDAMRFDAMRSLLAAYLAELNLLLLISYVYAHRMYGGC